MVNNSEKLLPEKPRIEIFTMNLPKNADEFIKQEKIGHIWNTEPTYVSIIEDTGLKGRMEFQN